MSYCNGDIYLDQSDDSMWLHFSKNWYKVGEYEVRKNKSFKPHRSEYVCNFRHIKGTLNEMSKEYGITEVSRALTGLSDFDDYIAGMKGTPIW